MILKFLTFVLVPFLCFAQEQPHIFQQLSSPLYNSLEPLEKLSDKEGIKELTEVFAKDIKEVKALGYKIDKRKNKNEIKEYLFKLRKLQKQYEHILHRIHVNIATAIDKKDYELFLQLTSYEFDGLLKSRTLFSKSLDFYTQNKHLQEIPYFENKIKYKAIQEQTEEFFNVVETSSYSSNHRSTNKKVIIEAVDHGKYIAIFVQNLYPYTITVKMKENLENFNYDSSVRKVFPLSAGTKKEYIKLYKQKEKISSYYSFSYSWIIGSIDAVHDESYIYRLPYKRGSAHIVTQGYNGKYTHKGHSQYAIDFGMKVGTKIYAARDGIVVKLKEDSNKGGVGREFSKYGNYVTIEHEDATFATYYHLKKKGVLVHIGDKVAKGDFIAYSGNTGYSSGPHLHLSIFKASSASRTMTIPIKFLSEKGLVDVPKQGISYTAK